MRQIRKKFREVPAEGNGPAGLDLAGFFYLLKKQWVVSRRSCVSSDSNSDFRVTRQLVKPEYW